jgi:hypothetical protein
MCSSVHALVKVAVPSNICIEHVHNVVVVTCEHSFAVPSNKRHLLDMLCSLHTYWTFFILLGDKHRKLLQAFQ